MCGIVAISSPDNTLTESLLEKAASSLSHRGPDHQGVWLSGNRRVGLGHARLSIIDLKTGDQPIANEDESLHIVANGEIYGYDEIIDSLSGKGAQIPNRVR